MKKIFTSILGLGLGCLTGSAQSVTGDWNGELSVMGSKLGIVFHFNDGRDGWTMDSPDQGAEGIAVKLLVNDNDSVALEIPAIGARYAGRLENGRLKGKFSQRGMAFELDLTPGKVKRNRPQTPQPPYPYRTEELSFMNPQDSAVLSGTLTIPDGVKKPPLAVLVSGSGQQNRDEEVFGHKPFAVIADRLARNGIASFRYDDRGTGMSTGLRPDLTTEDFRQDALLAVKMLREKKIAKNIGIIGHSEGGLIAFMIAGDSPKDVDFIVSLAGTAVNGEKILTRQISESTARAGQPMAPELIKAQLAALYAQPWYAWFMKYEPSEAIAKIKCPVFAANGSKDKQVDAEENTGALKEALPMKKKDRIVVYEGLNHLFQHADTGFADEYSRIEETFSEETIDEIANWIKSL